jgi:hypothetical protein
MTSGDRCERAEDRDAPERDCRRPSGSRGTAQGGVLASFNLRSNPRP